MKNDTYPDGWYRVTNPTTHKAETVYIRRGMVTVPRAAHRVSYLTDEGYTLEPLVLLAKDGSEVTP